MGDERGDNDPPVFIGPFVRAADSRVNDLVVLSNILAIASTIKSPGGVRVRSITTEAVRELVQELTV